MANHANQTLVQLASIRADTVDVVVKSGHTYTFALGANGRNECWVKNTDLDHFRMPADATENSLKTYLILEETDDDGFDGEIFRKHGYEMKKHFNALLESGKAKEVAAHIDEALTRGAVPQFNLGVIAEIRDKAETDMQVAEKVSDNAGGGKKHKKHDKNDPSSGG